MSFPNFKAYMLNKKKKKKTYIIVTPSDRGAIGPFEIYDDAL